MRDDAQHAGALSIPVQAGSEQDTTQLARPLGRAVRKSGGVKGIQAFCTIVPFSGLPDRPYSTARLQNGKAWNTARTELHVSSDDLPVSAVVTFRYTAAKHKVSQKYWYPMLSRNRLSAVDIQK